jgi:methylase of polypeptide subunit release factors
MQAISQKRHYELQKRMQSDIMWTLFSNKETFLNLFYSEIKNLKSNIVLTANLPYLTEEQFATEPSIQHEPKSALVAEKQGLALYEELLQQIKSITHYSVPITLYCEIDPTQSERMRALIHTYLPEATIEIVKDLCGLDRIFAIKL